VGSVLVRRVPKLAVGFLDDLNLLEGIDVIDSPLFYHRGIRLSIELGHHPFDALSHATAFESDAVMITADRRYYEKAAPLGRILLLERLTQLPKGVAPHVVRRRSWPKLP
jgi:hypothetical protein